MKRMEDEEEMSGAKMCKRQEEGGRGQANERRKREEGNGERKEGERVISKERGMKG